MALRDGCDIGFYINKFTFKILCLNLEFFLLEFFVHKIALTLSFKVTAVNCFSFIPEISLWGSRLI